MKNLFFGVVFFEAFLLSNFASATQVLSSHNLTIPLRHCQGDARLDITRAIPRLIVHSNKCRYIGQDDGTPATLRKEGFDLKKNEVRLISVQSPSGTILDSFLVDTREILN